MTFYIVFFQSQSIICLMMATNATPGTSMEPWVVAACLPRSHLSQNKSFVCACACERGRLNGCVFVDVDVQEDASLTTRSLFDAFNSA